ncbi:MAG: hypothetical protein U9Q99_01560, partial [Nanoarchaeota archaeon]|nr:hypothetical protein [Nanoarchaeota archaeon]
MKNQKVNNQKDQNIVFRHGTNHSGNRFTMCAITIDNQMSIGIAKCNKKDQFVKKTGRLISFGRAYKNQLTGKQTFKSQLSNKKEIFNEFFTKISS